MISLLKSEKADANVLFIKIEIEHGTKKAHFPMKHYNMLHRNYKRRLLH